MKKEPCIHHWKIDDVEGPTSQGVCLTCGATKTFPNTMYDPNFSKPSFGRRPIGRHQEIVLPGSRPFEQ